ncbi:MAG: hypothetical protein ACKOOL_01575 [Novosphingobium sp.]
MADQTPAHTPHPRIERRRKEHEDAAKKVSNFNGWLAVKITDIVGTMWCAYAFAGLALISLPQAIKGGTGPLIAWIAQTFLQLVLLSIIMVGQKVAAAASDRQTSQTYKDAEALLEITDDLHRLITINNAMTEEIQILVQKG